MEAYNNQGLFSDFYLEELIKEDEFFNKCREDAKEIWEKLKTVYEKEKPHLRDDTNEAETERRFIRPVLSIMGHIFALQPPLPTPEGTKVPDFAFFATEEDLIEAEKHKGSLEFFKKSIAVGDAKAWGRSLDKKIKGSGDPFTNQNPSYQIDFYIRESDRKWGILTNGHLWRLYNRETSYRMDVFYEVDLPKLLEKYDEDGFIYFWAFFRKEAFTSQFLDRAYKSSLEYSAKLGDELKENVYEALRLLAEGFLKYAPNRLDGSDLNTIIRENTFVLIYRILFILYAEDRKILPVDNPDYKSYSMRSLVKDIADKLDNNVALSPNASGYWARLRDLFKMINEGDKTLRIPPYNGGLFDNNKHKFLEEKVVGDLYLARAIDQLTRTKASGRAGRGFVNYRDLEIRHIGSIYEGLLEHRLRIANEDIVVIKEKNKEVFKPVRELDNVIKVNGTYYQARGKRRYPLKTYLKGEVYLETDKGERKATGSYYTPDFIVKYIVQNTLGPVLKDKKNRLHQEALQLQEKIKNVMIGTAQKMDYKRRLAEIENGTAYIDEILKTKVLDPAMGSGHFLVEATDFLARALVEALGVSPHEVEEDEIRWARREVVERCIFGVDINPLAVELAKLSLWLYTVARDKPLNFLDHHLRCGNSLIGARIDDLKTLPRISSRKTQKEEMEAAGQMTTFESIFRQDINRLLSAYAQIERIPSESVENIREKEKLYNKVKEIISRFQDVADIWTSVYFGNEVNLANYQTLLDKIRAPINEWGKIGQMPWFKKAKEIAKQKRFFHWELEFPEVFFEGSRRRENAGFDVVMGNPPYVDSEEMTNSQPELRAYCVNAGYYTASGNWDIFCIFIERSYLLCRRGGFFSMIVPNKLLAADYASAVRNILRGCTLHHLRDYSKVRVFEIDVYPIVFVVQKEAPNMNHKILIEVMQDSSFSKYPMKSFENEVDLKTFTKLPMGLWSPLVRRNFPLLQRILRVSVPLSNYGYVVGAATVSEAYDILNVLEDVKNYSSLPKDGLIFVNTGVIDRYALLWGLQNVVYINKIFKHPIVRRAAIRKISEKRLKQAISEKVIVAGIVRRLECIYDKGLFLGGKSTVLVLPKRLNLKFITSCLNSKLLSFVYQELFESLSLQGGYMRIGPPQIERLPIRRISFVTQKVKRVKFKEKFKDYYQSNLETE